MSYTKTNWENLPSTNTPINAARLNNIENGIKGNKESINNLSSSLSTVATSGSYNDLSNKPSLSTVATSGSYNDLSNKPTIPTVNNATLTIQKNGTNVQTFTANESSNKTANITVPTKTSLWSGSKNTTGNVTLSSNYTNYDWIAFTCASPNAECEQIFFANTSGLSNNKELNFVIFQTSAVYASITCSFTANTTLNIQKFSTTGSWGNFWLKKIDGIKF